MLRESRTLKKKLLVKSRKPASCEFKLIGGEVNGTDYTSDIKELNLDHLNYPTSILISVAGKTIRALFDTGSSVTLIDKTTFDHLMYKEPI